MKTASTRARRTTNAVLVYLIILVSFQVFLISIAVEAFSTGDKPLAWSAAGVSVVLALGAAFFGRVLRH